MSRYITKWMNKKIKTTYNLKQREYHHIIAGNTSFFSLRGEKHFLSYFGTIANFSCQYTVHITLRNHHHHIMSKSEVVENFQEIFHLQAVKNNLIAPTYLNARTK